MTYKYKYMYIHFVYSMDLSYQKNKRLFSVINKRTAVPVFVFVFQVKSQSQNDFINIITWI